jgi:hypothetical protein
MAEIRQSKNVANVRYLYDGADLNSANFVGILQDGRITEQTGYNKAVALSKNGRNVVMTARSIGKAHPEEIKVNKKTYYTFNY